MIPEAAVAMLACARVGAVHSVVFGGFAAAELAVRIDHSRPSAIVTATCGLEGNKGPLPYMPLVEEALDIANHEVPRVVVKRRNEPAAAGVVHDLVEGRDLDFEACLASPSSAGPEPLAAGHPLYTLYTSGTTGDPKAIVRDQTHLVALERSMDGYFGCGRDDVFFAASDIGWVVGHSYIVYAPLLHGCTAIMFEGKPVGTPDAATYWRVVEEYGVTEMFTAPTALRAIRKARSREARAHMHPLTGTAQADPTGELVAQHDLSTLRTLFVAGERADPDTVEHYESVLQMPVVRTTRSPPLASHLTQRADRPLVADRIWIAHVRLAARQRRHGTGLVRAPAAGLPA